MGIFVMPVWRQVVQSVDCYRGKLEEATDVVCFEGFHLLLAGVMGTLGLVFLLLLLPFTAAAGDVDLVPPSIWLTPLEWANRRRDKATGIDLGRLSPSTNPEKILAYAYA